MVLSFNMASGSPYQCSMEVSPDFAECTTFHRATAICAWCAQERRPSLLFSRMAVSMMAGAAPKNLIPSAPATAFFCTHDLASSGVEMVFSAPWPNLVYAKIRGAVMLSTWLLLLWSRVHFNPFIDPGSRMVVMP